MHFQDVPLRRIKRSQNIDSPSETDNGSSRKREKKFFPVWDDANGEYTEQESKSKGN